jgi:hypothetical protein
MEDDDEVERERESVPSSTAEMGCRGAEGGGGGGRSFAASDSCTERRNATSFRTHLLKNART